MSVGTKPDNTAERRPSANGRSGMMRHEASRSKRSTDTSVNVLKPKEPEMLLAVKAKRRIRYGADAGGPKTTYELQFRTSRKRRFRIEIDSTDLLRPARVVEKVVDAEGIFPADLEALRGMIGQCTHVSVPEVVRTNITGWRGSGRNRAFVTAAQTFGPSWRSFDFAASHDHAVVEGQVGSVRGDLAGWRKSVGRYLEMSSVGRVLLGAALAAPLLKMAGLSESWIFLLAGSSTAGKSTLLKGVSSFQGAAPPTSPRASDRRFNELAAKHNDLLFVVGDLSQLNKVGRRRVLHWLVMDATAGQPRSVSRTMRATLPDLPFTTIAALSAEETSAQVADGAGARQLLGESVRCFDLLPGAKGYFDIRPKRGRLEPEELAGRINSGADTHHGAGLKAWIEWLSGQPERRVRKKVLKLIDRFVAKADPINSLGSLERRAARKFGLVYAGLVLGRKAFITKMSSRQAFKAVNRCFKRSIAPHISVTPETALAALKEALGAPNAMLRTFQGGRQVKLAVQANPDWLAIDTKRGGRRVLGLRASAVGKTIGLAQAEAAFAKLVQERRLQMPKGSARWQKMVPGAGKIRLLELDPNWIEQCK